MAGPLDGVRIVEIAGIGPGPFCGMMLADHGAEVITVNRIGTGASPQNALTRSRKSIALDLKDPRAIDIVRDLVKKSDGVFEGFRPGVMEKLGLGPDVLLADNTKLVYGRMTGWGQFGSYAQAAGHDINYIALSGALHTCGRAGEKPTPPVNYLGDFGGGGMMLAFGMVSALLAVKNGADGQVIDCAMTDGSAALMAMTWWFHSTGMIRDERGVNALDTGAHYYDTYETSDGKWISIGSIEPQFYALLREKLGVVDDERFDPQNDTSQWPALKDRIAALVKQKSRDEWCTLMEGTDVCFAPVLSLNEAPSHPHNVERETYITVANSVQPAPAPRYSKTKTSMPTQTPDTGAHTDEILTLIGRSSEEVSSLCEAGVVGRQR